MRIKLIDWWPIWPIIQPVQVCHDEIWSIFQLNFQINIELKVVLYSVVLCLFLVPTMYYVFLFPILDEEIIVRTTLVPNIPFIPCPMQPNQPTHHSYLSHSRIGKQKKKKLYFNGNLTNSISTEYTVTMHAFLLIHFCYYINDLFRGLNFEILRATMEISINYFF